MSSTFDLSFLFDKNGKIDIHGLLAAIPVPLFLLLMFNLGILLLVTKGLLENCIDLLIFSGINTINVILFFYAGYNVSKYKLGLISCVLSIVALYSMLFIATYYTNYLIFIEIKNNTIDIYPCMPMDTEIPQMWPLSYLKNPYVSGLMYLMFVGGFLTALWIGCCGWLIGRKDIKFGGKG